MFYTDRKFVSKSNVMLSFILEFRFYIYRPTISILFPSGDYIYYLKLHQDTVHFDTQCFSVLLCQISIIFWTKLPGCYSQNTWMFYYF